MKNTTKTKPKSTALALPAITPKPSKADYINALLERARVAHGKEQASIKAKISELHDAYTKEVMALYEAGKGVVRRIPNCPSFDTEEAEIDIYVKSPKLYALSKEMSKLPRLSGFDEKEERKSILEGLQRQSPGLKALLGNADACAALDALLGVN